MFFHVFCVTSFFQAPSLNFWPDFSSWSTVIGTCVTKSTLSSQNNNNNNKSPGQTNNDCIGQLFSTLLMMENFSTVNSLCCCEPPNIKLFPLLFHKYSFTTIMNHNINIFGDRFVKGVAAYRLRITGLGIAFEHYYSFITKHINIFQHIKFYLLWINIL